MSSIKKDRFKAQKKGGITTSPHRIILKPFLLRFWPLIIRLTHFHYARKK